MALSQKSAGQLTQEAETLATSFQLVEFREALYMPVDVETGAHDVTPPVDRLAWRPLSVAQLQDKAREQFNTMFKSERDAASFYYMVRQPAIKHDQPVTRLLVRTKNGLKCLDEDGQLHDPDGTFVPNLLVPVLNEDPAIKAELMKILVDWVGHEEQAIALLRHLATALAPGWSSIRYVLLIGEGRNGKSTLMKMLVGVFGSDSCSSVTRQDISDKSVGIFDLNGKLLNVVMDGQATYLKDSGTEKSLVAGEPVAVRKLYQSTMSTVQTTALFVEGLNREPKSSDKSSALQTRIIRFLFENVFEDDLEFEERMLSEEYLGAFLSLLIDNYVKRSEKAVMLAPTKVSKMLQIEHEVRNSLALQFLIQVESIDPLGASSLLDTPIDDVVARFKSWRIKENDLAVWSDPDVRALLRGAFILDRRSLRVGNKVLKQPVIGKFTNSAAMLLESMQEAQGEEANDDTSAEVV
jgi:putative DNA primase/helicase